MAEPELTTVPRDLYYHEVAYVRSLEAAFVMLKEIVESNDSFRAQLPAGWEGDPLNDLCVKAKALIAKVKASP